MLTMQDIKSHYRFNGNDAAALLNLQPLAQAHQEELIDQFYDFLLGIPETASFLGPEAALKLIKKKHADWFLDLFNGTYDNLYMRKLQRTGHAHVRIGLPAHYVNSSMHLVRRFMVGLIETHFTQHDPAERQQMIEAMEKILDINLDVVSAAYHEESLKMVFLSKRFEAKLIHATERFAFGLNLILILALAGLSLSVIGLFVWEITHVFSPGKVEKGIMSALGTLLILWMMIELLNNEIKTLRGGHFNILVFVGVVIVAIIREILISTLRHDPLPTQAFLAGTLLVLGLVYWLVAKSQQAMPRNPHG